MASFRVTTPVPDFTGTLGAVTFNDGAAIVDEAVNPAELAYCRLAGYGVEEIVPAAPAKKAAASKESKS